jgi:hypothetical protein
MDLYSRALKKIARELSTFINLIKSTYQFYKVYKLPFRQKCIYTHIIYNIGDNIIHLNYLKKLAKLNQGILFLHFLKSEYINQISEYIIEDNIRLLPLEIRPIWSINSWKNDKKYWSKHPNKYKFEDFYLEYFDRISKKLGLKNPITNKEDLIIDAERMVSKNKKYQNYDYFIVNSEPKSDQFDYDENELNLLIKKISETHSIITTKKIESIPCTQDSNMTLYDIGIQSTKCKKHIMIATGPCWFALNSYNIKNSEGIYLLLRDEQIRIFNAIKNFQNPKQVIDHIYNMKN